MRRDVCRSVAFVFGFAISMLPLSAVAASVAQDAKKICLERYNTEKAGNTLPVGMPKSKYLSQCTKSYIRNAQLEAAAQADANRQAGTNQNGGSQNAQAGGLGANGTEPGKPPAPSGH